MLSYPPEHIKDAIHPKGREIYHGRDFVPHSRFRFKSKSIKKRQKSGFTDVISI